MTDIVLIVVCVVTAVPCACVLAYVAGLRGIGRRQ